MLFACGSQDNKEPEEVENKPINLDNEPNGTEADAGNIEDYGNITEGFSFSGTLDNDFEIDADSIVTSIILDIDYYKFELKEGDIISITASNKSSPFSFKFYGPCYGDNGDKSKCTDKTVDVANKSNSLQDTIKTGHLHGSDAFNSKAPFYIKVFSSVKAFESNVSYKSNPYIITVKLLSRNNN